MAIQPFLWGQGGRKMTPKDIERSRLEQALMRRDASDTSPVGHWTAGLNRALQGYVVGRDRRRADDSETAGRASGQEAIIAALGGGMSAPTSQPMSAIDGTAGGSSFMDSLINSESGGNWGALNNEGYGGRLQFGAARLADAARAGIIPAGIDGAAFSKLPPEQQMAVEQWHFNDIDQQAERMGLHQFIGQNVGGVPVTQDAIRGMAHLGGIGGTAKFLQSGGQYNPADSNGTSLRDYGLRHGGAGQSAPMQAGPSSAQIATLMSDPWAMEVGGPVIEALLGQTMQNENAALEQQRRQADPMYQAQLEAARLANQAARQPQTPKPIEVGGVLLDPVTFQPIFDSRQQQAPKAPDTQEFYDEATGQPYRAQWNPNSGSWDRIGGMKAPTGPLVQNNIGGGNKLDEELAKGEGSEWATHLKGGARASGVAQDMQLLDEIITLAPQGPITGRLAQALPGFNDAASAFQAVVSRVAPSLREEGSGSTSDIEYQGFLNSLPSLRNRPDANRAISGMMKAKAAINIERAQTVSAYRNGEISQEDARRKLQAINSRSILTPELRGLISATGDGSAQSGIPQGVDPADWEYMTPEERALFQ